MGAVDTTYTFTATDTITSAKMNNIIDQTTITTDAIIGTTLDVASGKLKIRSAGITSNEMGANSVVTASITDSNITTAKIADANVTQAKLATNVTTTGPAFHVNTGGTSQSLPNTGVVQIIQFDTELFDVGSCFNTSNYRFTPNVAGYYQINISIAATSNSGSLSLGDVRQGIRKNGTFYDIAVVSIGAQTSYVAGSGSILIEMNGTTDYIEGVASIAFASASAATVDGSISRTYMSGFLARSA